LFIEKEAYPPRWFNDLAEEQKVNFSAPLQKKH